jgi:putative tricarboxylic transport membrane protein
MSDSLDLSGPKDSEPTTRGVIRGPRNFAAGLTLLAFALFMAWAGRALDAGTMRSMGPGFMPRAVEVLVGLFGIGIALAGLVKHGPPIESWKWRGVVFVCAAILAFGATIRTTGIAVAGPLVMIIGGFASPEARWRELVPFALVITLVCILLFRYALGLAIPVFTIPGVVTL